MRFRDIVNQFHNQNRLANTSTTKQANLTAFGVRGEQVNNLNAGDQQLRFRRLLDKFRRVLVNGARGVGFYRPGFINRLTDDVNDTAQCRFPDRYGNRRTSIGHFLTAHQTFGRVHRNGANSTLAQMLCHFENQTNIAILRFQRIQNFRQFAVKLHIDNRTDDLADFACSC